MNGINYREHAVDIHSHVMVGLDDGAKSTEEAMDMFRQEWDQGMGIES